jgi:hypothetical protein
MPKWVHSSVFRLVIVVTMALGMLLSPIGSSASHNPMALADAEAYGHAELAAQSGAHGHSHDNDVTGEQSPGHAPGHNPADHTHETASVLPCFAQPMLQASRTWVSWPLAFGDLETPFRLERPPRQIVIA